MQILHITPHLGGGVGTVVMNWLIEEGTSAGNSHTIASLDTNKNTIISGLDASQGWYWDIPALLEKIKYADIVLVHWWNHPMLFDLLVNYSWPKCRVAMWNHVSCLYPPYVHSDNLLEFSDRFVFTSPVSYKCREIESAPLHLRTKLDSIWSSCGTTMFNGFTRINHSDFNIGLTGTVDYGKLHPDFAKICSLVTLLNARFIVCSGDSQERLKADVYKAGMADRFSFMGRVPSILPYLAMYDVFGYPLQPRHFGTCEQAIGEAMMAGAVPVVLDNPAERFIIDHGKTGFIARTYEEYAEYIHLLYTDRKQAQRISKEASDFARNRYSISKVIREWSRVFEKLSTIPKSEREWVGVNRPANGSMTFAESLGEYGNIFRKYLQTQTESEKKEVAAEISSVFQGNTQWLSDNKGGAIQYSRVFPEDKTLREWATIAMDVRDRKE